MTRITRMTRLIAAAVKSGNVDRAIKAARMRERELSRQLAKTQKDIAS